MTIELIPIAGIPEVRPGDDLAGFIADAAARGPAEATLRNGDVVVVTQKVVSKAENQLVRIDPDDPAAKARLVASQAVRILRRRGGTLIVETRHGFICATAGIDR